jgi:hypothetical protein
MLTYRGKVIPWWFQVMTLALIGILFSVLLIID